jgi:uncharacterized protein (DUF169 family)
MGGTKEDRRRDPAGGHLGTWRELSGDMERLLRLRTAPVAYRRLDREEDLDQLKDLYRLPHLSTFCQTLFMARIQGRTIGIAADGKLWDRCMRIHGLKAATEKSMREESSAMGMTWFANPDDAYAQQLDYPRVPQGGAIVVSPLAKERIEPEVVLVFGTPAQVMMLLCGLQKERYERYPFFFIGEGACADSLAQCYVNGKPAVAIPCYGERAIGQVADDELVVALPPTEVPKAISGMQKLARVGLRYPISFIGGHADIGPMMSRINAKASKSRA